MKTLCLSTNGWNHFKADEKPSLLFVATIDGVEKLRRVDDGTWEKSATLLKENHVSAILYEPENNGLFVSFLPGGIMFSADLGETWEERSAGIKQKGVYSLRSNQEAEATVLYCGTEPASLYRSSNYGLSWNEVEAFKNAPMSDKWQFPAPGYDPHLKTMAFDPNDPKTIYAGVEQGGLLKTIDGGESWIDVDEFVDYDHFVYKDIHQIMISPENSNEVFLTTGLGLFHTDDRGESWEQYTDSDFRIGYPDQLLFSPDDVNHLFMSGGFATPNNWIEINSARGTIVISEDAGRNWRAPKNGFPEGRANVEAMSMIAYPGGYDIFAGTTDGIVFISEDKGETWNKIMENIAPISKPTHETLIAGVAYGTEPG